MKIRRIDFYPDDFLSGVSGMTPEEVGVYWFVCSLIYSTGGPITLDDDRWRGLRIRKDRLKSIVSQLEVKRKLTVSPTEVTQNRCVSEIERAKFRTSSAVTNGLSGGRPKKNNYLEEPGGLQSGLGEKKAIIQQPTDNNQQSSRESMRGSRMYSDFSLPADWYDWTIKEGFPENQLNLEFESWKDFWCGVSGNDGLKRDWFGTWRNRVRKKLKEAVNGTPISNHKSNVREQALDLIARKYGEA